MFTNYMTLLYIKLNDDNAPKAPRFNHWFWSRVPTWYSPLGDGTWEREAIPFGPYLSESDDLSAQSYTTTAMASITELFRICIAFTILFVIIPITILIFSIRCLRA